MPDYVRRWSFLRFAVARWSRPVWLSLTLVGGAIVVLILASPNAHGVDARGYWSFELTDPYRGAFGNLQAFTAFRYAPPIALLFMPLHALPWPVFVTSWSLLCLAALIFLSGRHAFALAALYPFAIEISAGNVNLLIGVAVVMGFRWPVLWSFVLLTKVTPGVGLIWFALRREWRELAIALGATAAISALSWVCAPAMWGQWVAALGSMVTVQPTGLYVPIPLPIRFVAAIVLVAWGARTNRKWTVLVGATLAMPTMWASTISPLAGLFRLRDSARDTDAGAPQSAR